MFNFEDFFELSPDLLVISTSDGYFKKVNNATAKVLGYSKEELYAKPINHFVHPEDKKNTSNIRSRLSKVKTIYNFDNRYVTKSGDVVWLSWTARVSETDNLIYAVAKEITQKKIEELDKDLLINDLSEKNQSFIKLTYTTAHDLRSPVDSLLSIFKLIDMDSIINEKNKKLMELLQKGSEQLKAKLNEYIDNLSKGQKIQVELEEVYFKEALQAVLDNIKSLVNTSDLTIDADFSEAEKVSFNKDYMHSIFLNLISNSIKYAKPDVNPHVQIKSTLRGDDILLTFTDNGIGIDQEKAKGKVFGLHQTFHENSDSKGIGLYLVYTHINSFGGDITLDSSPGEGCTFTLKFPQVFA